MDYLKEIKEYLSVCSGKIMNVYYELYAIVEQLDEKEQPVAIEFICENIESIQSDDSYEIIKNYFTDEQLERVTRKFFETDLLGIISTLAENAAKEKLPPLEFYTQLWNRLKNKYKTKRERALVLYELTKNDLIPYRAVGTGLSMSNEEYRQILKDIGKDFISETEYILDLDYEQKTQRASLLVDKLLMLNDRKKQSVYMAKIINAVENNIKKTIKEMLN
ncbi:MAG: hypothetical protein K5761_06400 [Clostridiales bacterium]|nr:hypothetical protein [Clostridiales bacterium]